MENLLNFFIWFLVAFLYCLPLIFCFYILLKPADELAQKWITHRLRATGLPLKDEHFKRLPGRIFRLKVLSAIVVAVLLGAFFALLYVKYL